MFYVSYMFSELRRRKGRTILTAHDLALDIGVVVTVGALSTGLDRAQAKVLAPLTGVGTDLSVTRPIKFGNNGPAGLSATERQQLQKENGGARFGLQGLGKPGSHFSRDDFVSASQLSFTQTEVAKIRALDGVKSASGALTLTAVAAAIKRSFSGASVTTAKDLAARVSGSLVDAKNLTSKLGLALEIVGLAAAFLIACLLTLASVTKRVRELGTLKALGWPQRLVVRQVTGEALVQGVLGGIVGVALGIGAAGVITYVSPSLQATVAQAATQGPRIIAF